MNVNKWETLGEKKSAETGKEGLGIAAYLSICSVLLADYQLLIWTKFAWEHVSTQRP